MPIQFNLRKNQLESAKPSDFETIGTREAYNRVKLNRYVNARGRYSVVKKYHEKHNQVFQATLSHISSLQDVSFIQYIH
jgi:type IV secretory pathway component VirB8